MPAHQRHSVPAPPPDQRRAPQATVPSSSPRTEPNSWVTRLAAISRDSPGRDRTTRADLIGGAARRPPFRIPVRGSSRAGSVDYALPAAADRHPHPTGSVPGHRRNVTRSRGGATSNAPHRPDRRRAHPVRSVRRRGPRRRRHPILLVSAGIGCTPMVAMVEHLAATGSSRPVRVLHADRSPADHALRPDTRRLVGQLRDARAEFWYDEDATEEPGSRPGLWTCTAWTCRPAPMSTCAARCLSCAPSAPSSSEPASRHAASATRSSAPTCGSPTRKTEAPTA
ncbi:Flavohemoprotein [Streptomyces sp. enrichment culture]